jgi:hypothetical protein
MLPVFRLGKQGVEEIGDRDGQHFLLLNHLVSHVRNPQRDPSIHPSVPLFSMRGV